MLAVHNRPKHDTNNGNRRNEIVELSHVSQKFARYARYTYNGNRRNEIAEFSHTKPEQSKATTPSRQQPQQNRGFFPHISHTQLSAQTQHKQQNGNRRNKIVEFTHDAIQSHNPKSRQQPQQNRGFFPHISHMQLSAQTQHKQQNGNRRNKIVEYPRWSHPKDASANMIQTTLSGNGRNKIAEFSHGGGARSSKFPACKNRLNTSFSKENSEFAGCSLNEIKSFTRRGEENIVSCVIALQVRGLTPTRRCSVLILGGIMYSI